MNKFVKALKAINSIIRNPYLLNKVSDEESSWKKYVNEQYQLPLGLPFVDITTLFNDFDIKVSPYAYLDGATLPIDIALLKALAMKYKVGKYFEIGTWRGESVANIAEIVPECYTLNLPDLEMFEMGMDEDYVKMHRFFSENKSNIKHISGNSHTFDFSNWLKKFDMVFVDGDHHYQSVKKDTQTAFELVKDENSIIVWHDYAYEPETIRWSVMSGILDGCPSDKRNRIYHISNTLCAVYLNEKLESDWLKINVTPKHWFEVNIKSI